MRAVEFTPAERAAIIKLIHEEIIASADDLNGAQRRREHLLDGEDAKTSLMQVKYFESYLKLLYRIMDKLNEEEGQ